eukprot:scaffold20006_cov84-Isochrysis_galbana.AAC.1
MRVQPEQDGSQAAKGIRKGSRELPGVLGRRKQPAGIQADELAQQLHRPPAHVSRQVCGKLHGQAPLRYWHTVLAPRRHGHIDGGPLRYRRRARRRRGSPRLRRDCGFSGQQRRLCRVGGRDAAGG